MHTGLHDDARRGARRFTRELERISAEVADTEENVGGHVVVRQHHRVVLALQTQDVRHQRRNGGPLHFRHHMAHALVKRRGQRRHFGRVVQPRQRLRVHGRGASPAGVDGKVGQSRHRSVSTNTCGRQLAADYSYNTGPASAAPSMALRTTGIGGPPYDKNWSWKAFSVRAGAPAATGWASQSWRSFKIISLPSV